MEIQLHASHVHLNDKMRQAVDAAFARAVRAHEKQVQDIHVHLEDVNGHKGGVDKLCKVVARMAHGGHTVVIEERADDMLEAIRKASHRFEQALDKEIARWRERRRE